MQAIMETLFDAVYLITVITLGIIMITKSKDRKEYKLFGIMAVVLGCGDAFHLIPRASCRPYRRSWHGKTDNLHNNDYFLSDTF